jgi:hypothetical protein
MLTHSSHKRHIHGVVPRTVHHLGVHSTSSFSERPQSRIRRTWNVRGTMLFNGVASVNPKDHIVQCDIRNQESAAGGPRPGCMQVYLRRCQTAHPNPKTADGARSGKTTTFRTLSIPKQTEVEKIWREAERRLGTDRSHFSLVSSVLQHLPTEGTL